MARDTDENSRAVREMNEARAFPGNTCPASRHAAMIAEHLVGHKNYPMLSDEPDHCGGSIASTVQSLWEARTLLLSIGYKWDAGGWRRVDNK